MKSKDIYKLSSSADTHLIKNNEWGAVAYLAASQYGKIPQKNEFVDNATIKYHMYTGGGKENNEYKDKCNQSTTGNITGIYDLNGGAYERVAAYWDNGNDNLTLNAGQITVDGKTIDLFDSNKKLNSKFAAYWDKYEVSNDEKNGLEIWNLENNEENIETKNKALSKQAYDRIQLMKRAKGDAMYEIIRKDVFSYYGVESKNYKEGGLQATYDKDGNLTGINYSKINLSSGLYDGDYVVIGTYNVPFLGRGGYAQDSGGSGILNNYCSDGKVRNGPQFSSCNCFVNINITYG